MSVKNLGIVGKKVAMTQVFDEEGDVVPVTLIEIAENIVTDIRTIEKNGYNAIQIGNFENKAHRFSKPRAGHLKKNNIPLLSRLQEFRLDEAASDLKVGEALNVEEFFKDLKKINVTGTSIGKGFQGGVKLHNMSVGRRSHGSKSMRQIGSLGAGTTPSRVFKGKRMPAMMGNRTVTTTKVSVFKYDAENRLLLVKGPVPGKAGTEITIKAYGLQSWNAKNKKIQAETK
jgi:large subunit ribosomal protein L3